MLYTDLGQMAPRDFDMKYSTLKECVDDLESAGHLIRIEQQIDPYLEAAEIHRRVYRNKGPAVFYASVKGSRFPMVSNLFGTLERARFVFRDTLDAVRRLVALRVDPRDFWRSPGQYMAALPLALSMRPKFCRSGPILRHSTTVGALPQLVCWPRDGGAFITLPQVYSEHPDHPGVRHSNLGMYRVQISGNAYRPDREVGLHYQIHRGIGVHHAAAIRCGAPLRVQVFVGGTPALNLAAVMPLPEGMPELGFAGALSGRRIRLVARPGALPVLADADFCITGTVDSNRLLPEGPFGDHLGYYSLQHEYPAMLVENVYHRDEAVWPFTVVGRPPQEDTVFGQLIHEISAPAITSVLPGVQAVHAVDAAGVHPLLLAVGTERYTPYAEPERPQELLTQAHAILGQGQLSLAKYLLIVNHHDDPTLDIDDVAAFFRHLLQRVDWRRDLHFQTRTTIDTLDYSGTGINEGSKLVVAAVGPVRRSLPVELPTGTALPEGFRRPRLVLPGIVVVEAPPFAADRSAATAQRTRFCAEVDARNPLCACPFIALVDDSDMASRSLNNFLWTVFTKSDPAQDVDGVGSFTHDKHWGCDGPLVVDARSKPHHAPPLVEDADVSRRVDALGAPGGPLHGII